MHLLRGQLRSLPANGYTAFLPQVRKVVLEFCQHYPSSRNTRSFVAAHLERVARENPHVEFVLKQRNGHQPIARGFYGVCQVNACTPARLLSQSQWSGQGHSAQQTGGDWHRQKSPAAPGLVGGKDKTIEGSTDGGEHIRVGERDMEWIARRHAIQHIVYLCNLANLSADNPWCYPNTPFPHDSVHTVPHFRLQPALHDLSAGRDPNRFVGLLPDSFLPSDLPPTATLNDLECIHEAQLTALIGTSFPKRTYTVLCRTAYAVSSSTPPQEDEENSGRQHSILFESAPSSPNSPYFRQKWLSPQDAPANGALCRSRQSVSSIGSCSTVQTRTVPVKSILTRHDSGVSMSTTTRTRRPKKRSPPSVKFVDIPTVHYERSGYHSPPCSPSSPSSSPGQRKLSPTGWFMKWWKRSHSPPPRPTISGPYRLSHTASLVDLRRSRKSEPGKLKRLWIRVTNAIG
ncbi:hypothetical protein V8B97DRAFT_2009042 [Scleroderma yunnanense]